MPALSGIYDSAWVQPICKIKENLSLWTLGKWQHYVVDYIEPIPPGTASQVEMVGASGATTLAANATIAKQVVVILQINDNEFLQVRWEPLDYVEGVIWELGGQQKLAARSIHSRVGPNSKLRDPHLALTTFFIMGLQRDMNLEVRNPTGYATPTARFQFWGIRYLITTWDFTSRSVKERADLAAGDLETVKRIIGSTTWVPAEGRA